MTILDGKALAKEIRQQIKQEIHNLKQTKNVVPGLSVILVGDDPASKTYVSTKEKICAQLGVYSREFYLPESTSEQELLNLINELNQDGAIHGILVQLPLPKHINYHNIISAIDPAKDVDGFHPLNIGNLMAYQPYFYPCTPLGIIQLLEKYQIPLAGKHAVIIGRSNIVGKPLALMLLARHATVTICHSRTPDLAYVTKQADILVAAVGCTGLVKAEMVKDGAVVIDVGTNLLDDGKLVGDVDFDAVLDKVTAITPVPGGIGPMTIAMLMQNTVKSASHFSENQKK